MNHKFRECLDLFVLALVLGLGLLAATEAHSQEFIPRAKPLSWYGPNPKPQAVFPDTDADDLKLRDVKGQPIDEEQARLRQHTSQIETMFHQIDDLERLNVNVCSSSSPLVARSHDCAMAYFKDGTGTAMRRTHQQCDKFRRLTPEYQSCETRIYEEVLAATKANTGLDLTRRASP